MSGTDHPPGCHDDIIERIRNQLDHAVRYHRNRDLPFITLTYAQSLDGCIAQSNGGKLLLSNRSSQKLTHQVRALHDAILVGINTVLNDNPRLNVRLVEGKDPQPVVVDSRLRFPLDANLLRNPCVRPIIVAGTCAGDADKERRLIEAGANVMRMPLQNDGSIHLASLLIRLKQLGIHSVMVEGGAKIITSVLASHLANQFLLTIAPRFVGGMPAVKLQGCAAYHALPRLRNVHFQWLAGDLILRGDFDSEADRSAVRRDQQSMDRICSQTLDGSRRDGATEAK